MDHTTSRADDPPTQTRPSEWSTSGRPAAPDADRRRAVGRRSFMAGVSATGAGLLATPAAGTPTDTSSTSSAGSTRTPSFEAFFEDRIPTQLDEYDLAGATVAVVADSEVAFTKGYGYADVDAEEQVRPDETLFRVASTSKAVTGTAVMRAVEAGHVDLDTDVSQYLDDVPIPATYPEPVTLEHLGTHTAGFESEYIGQYARDGDDPRPLGAVLADPPSRVHPPGEVAHYSNYGIALAGHAVGTAADSTFLDYVQRDLFEPLGMARSTFRATPPGDLADTLTKAYDYDEDTGSYEEIEVPYELRRPAGSLATTAADMARFMLVHLQGGRLDGQQVLAPETVDGMHERRFTNHPRSTASGTCSSKSSAGPPESSSTGAGSGAQRA